MLRPLLPLVALATLALAACGDDSVHVERAPDFPKAGGAAVSVFGVYRDGRLAPEAWDTLRPHLAPLFGAEACDPGYPEMLTTSGTPVLQAVDDFARANGVTDELIDRLAPMAKGDLVLLVTMTGRPRPHTSSEAPSTSAPPTFRGTGHRGSPAMAPSHRPLSETAAFEMVGVVFSVRKHRSVGAIRLAYSGASFDEAIDHFMARLGAELPGASCAGWTGTCALTWATFAGWTPSDVQPLALSARSCQSRSSMLPGPRLNT